MLSLLRKVLFKPTNFKFWQNFLMKQWKKYSKRVPLIDEWMTSNSVFTPTCFRWSGRSKILWNMIPPRKSSVHMKPSFYNLLATIQTMTLQLLMEKIHTMGLVPLLLQMVIFQTQKLYCRLFCVPKVKLVRYCI